MLTDTPQRRTLLKLSTREQQILALLRNGRCNKEIANELHLAVGTVKVYLSRLYEGFGVQNRTEMALWATRHPDLLHTEEWIEKAA
ncbi:MAG: LuxR C-terminal-related transcriptional regulator [Acidobacteria bacterium]|nr:LuxR C-terminal-related transcriptional regulator [Acidobacteriota bacterium]